MLPAMVPLARTSIFAPFVRGAEPILSKIVATAKLSHSCRSPTVSRYNLALFTLYLCDISQQEDCSCR